VGINRALQQDIFEMENEYYPKKTFKRSGKKKPRCSLFKLRNPWGNESYRDLITNAILSSPSKQLTLAEIYSWMTENIPYFKENDKPKSHGGWKVSSQNRCYEIIMPVRSTFRLCDCLD